MGNIVFLGLKVINFCREPTIVNIQFSKPYTMIFNSYFNRQLKVLRARCEPGIVFFVYKVSLEITLTVPLIKEKGGEAVQ